MPVIGILIVGDPYFEPQLRAFRHGLQDTGYVEGQNPLIDIRSAEVTSTVRPTSPRHWSAVGSS
jgi:hypothetical protein